MLGSTRRLEKGLPWETAPSQNTPGGARLGDVCQEPGVFASIHAPTTSNQAACPSRPECPSVGLCPLAHIIPFHQVKRPLSLRAGVRWASGSRVSRASGHSNLWKHHLVPTSQLCRCSSRQLLKGVTLPGCCPPSWAQPGRGKSCAKVNDGAEESWRMWLWVWLDTDSECWSGHI